MVKNNVDRVDKLEIMFQKQAVLQRELGNDNLEWNVEYIKVNILAITDEIMEVLRETPWKPWKKQQVFDKDKYKEELVDTFHFFMNLCLAGGMNADELFMRYNRKNAINHLRKKKGY